MDRLIAIGDIHGCLQPLRILLEEKLLPTKKDTLVFLGDYIDRGLHTKGVIDYLLGLKEQGYACIFLKGNHEQTLLDAIDKEKNLKKGFFGKPKNQTFINWYESYGGRQALNSYGLKDLNGFPQAHEDFLRSLQLYHQTDDYYFVHAGFNFANEDILSDTHAMLWIRDFDYDAKKAGGRKVVHGHVPVQLEFLKECISLPHVGFIPLDTGCVYRQRLGLGYLSGLDLTNGILHSVKNQD